MNFDLKTTMWFCLIGNSPAERLRTAVLLGKIKKRGIPVPQIAGTVGQWDIMLHTEAIHWRYYEFESRRVLYMHGKHVQYPSGFKLV